MYVTHGAYNVYYVQRLIHRFKGEGTHHLDDIPVITQKVQDDHNRGKRIVRQPHDKSGLVKKKEKLARVHLEEGKNISDNMRKAEAIVITKRRRQSAKS